MRDTFVCEQKVKLAVSGNRLPKEYSTYVEEVCEGAVRGRDVELFSSIDEWIDWLSWSTVVLDEQDYLTAAVHSLDLAPKLAGTDYGTARQRDLGQLWTDTIRGFLGEIAFVKWLKQRFGISAQLDYRKGPLEEFLPTDIKEVNGRKPKINISIKTTKLGGIWLDIPFKQIEHSDVFVLVRIGVTREHFLAFLKKISVIKDKILEKAVELSIISSEELKKIWNRMPDFTNIPAYVAGFFDKRDYGDRIKDTKEVFLVDGEMKVKKFRVNKYVGYWHPEQDVYKKKLIELLRSQQKHVPDRVEFEFEGIGDFSRTLHFVVSSGALKKKKEDWEKLINEI